MDREALAGLSMEDLVKIAILQALQIDILERTTGAGAESYRDSFQQHSKESLINVVLKQVAQIEDYASKSTDTSQSGPFSGPWAGTISPSSDEDQEPATEISTVITQPGTGAILSFASFIGIALGGYLIFLSYQQSMSDEFKYGSITRCILCYSMLSERIAIP